MKIVQLDKLTLHQTIALRNKVFPVLEPLEEETLMASVYPNNYISWYKDVEIGELNYWVGCGDDLIVKGLVGLYTEVEVKKTKAWLGWFCVDPKYRGENIGSHLLNFALKEAKDRGYKEIHLYTTEEREYMRARIMYEKKGFTQYKFIKEDEMIWYKKKLG